MPKVTGIFRALCATATFGILACGHDSGTIPNPGMAHLSSDSVGNVVADSFYSPSLGVKKKYLVYLPASYATSPSREYPVAYFLHGTETNERSWVDQMHLDRALDSLASVGVPEMIVVMPDGDDSFFHNWYTTPDYASCLSRGVINGDSASWYCVKSAQYDDYITKDLVTHIDQNYRTLSESNHRGIAGLSMGGYGAIYLTLKHNDIFGAAAALSPAILPWLNISSNASSPRNATSLDSLKAFYGNDWTTYDLQDQFGPLSNWENFDVRYVAQAFLSAHNTLPPIWIMVGKDDNEALLGDRIFHNAAYIGTRITYTETSGMHTPAFWTAHAGDAAAWLARLIKP